MLCLLLFVATLGLLVVTNALKYAVSLVVAVLFLNGVYHAILTMWRVYLKVVAIIFEAGRGFFTTR